MQPGMMTPGPRDVGTPILLLPPDDDPDGCRVSFKQATVRSHAGKHLGFNIENYCTSAYWIMVGNFRTGPGQDPPPTNCDDAVAPGVDRIFDNDSAGARRKRVGGGDADNPGRGKIRLKIRKGSELPGEGQLSYYFDVCLNDVIAQDPRLIIER